MTDPSGVLAIDGGTPVRASMLPYGRQCIDEDDIAAVANVLRSDLLTTGPLIGEFEEAFGAVNCNDLKIGILFSHTVYAPADKFFFICHRHYYRDHHAPVFLII